MTDIKNIKFGVQAVSVLATICIFAVSVSIYVVNKLNDIENKVDILTATNKGIHDVQEVLRVSMQEKIRDISDQVNVNTMTIKSIADFIKPEEPQIRNKNYR